MGVIGLCWLLSSAAFGKEAVPGALDTVKIGELEVGMVQPEGLIKVNGLCPEADKFMESLKDLFKLNVLAVYANPDQWTVFVNGLSTGQPRLLPSIAVISSTIRMEGKSYDQKSVVKERRRLNNLIGLAINTKPLSMVMSNRANAKLRQKLGRELGFSYSTGQDVGRFAETERSISFALKTSLNLNGLRSDSFVTASALNVGDKFIYLTWFTPDRSPEGMDKQKTQSIVWMNQVSSLNANLAASAGSAPN
jgi:hypothetical protein